MANTYTKTKAGEPVKYGGTKLKRKKAKKKSTGGNSHLTGQARKAEEALHKSAKRAAKY